MSARVFAIAFLLLLAVGSVLFGLIAWASPVTYTAVVNDDLQQKLDALVQELAETDFADSGAALDAFIRSAGVQVALENERGEIVETPSLLALRTVSGDGVTVVSDGEAEDASQTTVSVTTADVATAAVRFAGGDEVYTLYVTPNLRAENIAVRALAKMAPWILLALLGFSLVCALVFARLVARPIVRLSAIAEKMADLDFGWRCALRCGMKSARWAAAWSAWPKGFPPPWASFRRPTAPCAAKWSASGRGNRSGWPSSPPLRTN